MKLSCYVIDDEPHAVAILKTLINTIPGLTLSGSATNAQAGCADISAFRPDITFMDIDMQDINGLQLVPLVKDRTTVVFTTAFPDYAPDAFGADVFDYILKPVTIEKLVAVITRYNNKILPFKKQKEDYLLLKTGIKNQLLKIEVREIIYIQGASNYIELHFQNHKTVVYLTLTEILERLASDQFIRISKSFIVNEHFIARVEGNYIILNNGISITIGEVYAPAFRKRINPHIVKSKWD